MPIYIETKASRHPIVQKFRPKR